MMNLALIFLRSWVLLLCAVTLVTTQHSLRGQALVPDYYVTRIAVSGDGSRLAVLGHVEQNAGNSVFFIDILDSSTLEILNSVNVNEDQPGFLDLSPDGRWVVYSRAFAGLIIIDTATGERTRLVASGVVEVEQLDWNPIDRRLAYSLGNTTTVVDMSGELPEVTLRDPEGPGLMGSIAWTSDGRDIATNTYVIDRRHPENNIFNIQIWREEQLLSGGNITNPSIRFSGGGRRLFWSPDGNWIANNYATGGVTIFDADTGEQTFLSTGGTEDIAAIAWNPDSTQVAAGGIGGIWIWDIASEQIVNTISVDAAVGSMIWSPTLGLIHNGAGDGLFQNGTLVTAPIMSTTTTPTAAP